MSCPNETEWVLYAAGELPAARHSELQTHLTACDACRRQARAMARGLKALETLDRDAPMRAEAMEAVRRRLRVAAAHPQPARPTVLSIFRRWGWAAAAAAVLVGAMILSNQPTPQINVVQPPPKKQVPKKTPDAPVANVNVDFPRDSQIQEELAELTATVEMLELADKAKTPEAKPVPPTAPAVNKNNDDPTAEIEEWLQSFGSESGV
jgi:hypothetical protein